jgi:hypothetical protein
MNEVSQRAQSLFALSRRVALRSIDALALRQSRVLPREFAPRQDARAVNSQRVELTVALQAQGVTLSCPRRGKPGIRQ